jgi:hypothetical protein
MFETILAYVLPFAKDLLWTACAAMLALVLTKIKSQFI